MFFQAKNAPKPVICRGSGRNHDASPNSVLQWEERHPFPFPPSMSAASSFSEDHPAMKLICKITINNLILARAEKRFLKTKCNYVKKKSTRMFNSALRTS